MSQTTSNIPLARDADGQAVVIPPTAVAWRVRRQTGGRPRVVLGPDQQPLCLPLEATEDDLVDVVGAGTYRLEAIDQSGRAVGGVVSIEVAGSSSDVPSVHRGGDQLRFVLDANVQMARSLAEAVRMLSQAQADWTKGLAQARAMPRNAPPTYTERVVEVVRADDDEEDAPSKGSIVAQSFIAALQPHLPELLAALPHAITALGNCFRVGSPMPATRNAAEGEGGGGGEP